VVCGWASEAGVEACGCALAGGAADGGGLGLLRSCRTAEGAEGRSSEPEDWAKSAAPNKILPNKRTMPRNFMRS
jgi:hypothetical protein